MWNTGLAFVLALVLGAIIRLAYVLYTIHTSNNKKTKRSGPVRTLVVLGSGGHTTEMLRLFPSKAFPFARYTPLDFLIADTDRLSAQRLNDHMKDLKVDYSVASLPRAREVGQSYLTSVLTTIKAFVYSLVQVFSFQPDLILCNGPGTCVPVCVSGFILRFLGLKRTKIVYVESVCRVTTLSMSAHILYYFADLVLVQWEDLAKRYPRCQYIGRLT